MRKVDNSIEWRVLTPENLKDAKFVPSGDPLGENYFGCPVPQDIIDRFNELVEKGVI